MALLNHAAWDSRAVPRSGINLLPMCPVRTEGYSGADRGTRTPDPQFTKLPLYQLSYVGP